MEIMRVPSIVFRLHLLLGLANSEIEVSRISWSFDLLANLKPSFFFSFPLPSFLSQANRTPADLTKVVVALKGSECLPLRAEEASNEKVPSTLWE